MWCGCVTAGLCSGVLVNKTNIDGVFCHQRPAWAAAVCQQRERTLRGLSGCRISPAQLFGVKCIFSVLDVMSWCPEVSGASRDTVVNWSAGEELYPKINAWFKPVFYPHPQMETAALWLTQTFAVWDKNSHPFVRGWHHCAHLFADCIKSVFRLEQTCLYLSCSPGS